MSWNNTCPFYLHPDYFIFVPFFLVSSSSVMMCDMMQEGSFPDNKKYIFAISHLNRKTKNYFPFYYHYRPFRRISCVQMTERLVETNLFIHDNEKMHEMVSLNSRVVCSITPPTPLIQEEIVAFSIIGQKRRIMRDAEKLLRNR